MALPSSPPPPQSQVSELSRERDHWKGQSEELRDQVARASAEVSNLRAKGAETQVGSMLGGTVIDHLPVNACLSWMACHW